MADKNKKEVAPVEEQSTAMAEYAGYEEDSGAGMENLTQDDLLIPYINLLQGLSPEVEENGVPGAKPGMIYNPATGQLFPGSEGIAFIPCYYEHYFVEWEPRAKGGGFVAIHETSSAIVLDAKDRSTDFGKHFTPDGNILAETYYVYGLALDDEGMPTRSVISFASTKIKQFKQLVTLAKSVLVMLPNNRKVNPPLWAHRFRLRTLKTKNNEGEFYVYQVGFDGDTASSCRYAPADELYKFAKAFKVANDEGQTKTNYDSTGGKGASADGGGADDEIPF